MDSDEPVIRTIVNSFIVELSCVEKDCDGKIEFCGGSVLLSNPAQYPHKCSKCGIEQHITGRTYPYIDYE